MRYFIYATFFLSAILTRAQGGVDIAAKASTDRVAAGQTFAIDFDFSIPKGVHIYAFEGVEIGQPTRIDLKLPRGYSLKSLKYPAPEKFSFLGIDGIGYSHNFKATAEIFTGADISDSVAEKIVAEISWLACSDQCIPGETTVELAIKGINASPPSAPQGGAIAILGVLGLAFLGGAILNLMPCVFPVIGLKIISFAEGAKLSRKSALAGAMFYTLGIVGSFWILGALLILLRALGENLGWGFQLQNPMFTAFMALLFFAMALSFAGVFEIGSGFAGGSASEPEGEKSTKSKYVSAILSGVLAVLVASPCTAPFMGAAVGAALAAEASNALSMGVFTAIGLGMASPYILLTSIPRLAKSMPRPGAWMDILKQILSVPLFATVVWLVWVYSNQTGGVLWILIALLIIAIGARVFGMFYMPHYSAKTRGIAATAFAAAIILSGISAYAGAESKSEDSTASAVESENVWSPARQTELLKQGKNVYVDFTASWCLTCQYNKTILHSKKIESLFKDNDVVILVGDWTNKNPSITAELAKFGRAGVPLNLLYSPTSDSPEVLPAILTESAVIEAIDKIKE